MKSFRTIVLAAATLALYCRLPERAALQAQPADLRRASAESSLAHAKTATCVVRVYGIDKDENGKSVVTPGQKFSMMMQRPGSLKIEDTTTAADISDAKAFDVMANTDFVSDGKHQCEYNRVTKVAHVSAASPDFAHVTSEGITDVLAVNILLSVNFGKALVYRSRDVIDGKPVKVFTKSKAGSWNDEAYVVYLSAASGLPVRIIAGQDNKGTMIPHRRLDFSGWRLNITLPRSTFSANPPAQGRSKR